MTSEKWNEERTARSKHRNESTTGSMARAGASGQSRAVPVVMMAALAIALGSILSGQLLGLTHPLGGGGEPPMISQTAGSVQTQDDGGQVVQIRHISGDVATVSQLEIVVDADDACRRQARLVGLPGGTSGKATVEGADIFGPGAQGSATVGVPSDGEWGAGEAIKITIDSDRCRIGSDEGVTVSVVHQPSGTVVLTERLTG